MITVTNFGNGVDGVYEVPKEVEVPYVKVTPKAQDEKPFAVVDPNGAMTAFDLDICHTAAQRFIDGDQSPINTTCFVIVSLLDALYKRAENHKDLDSFRKEIQNLKF